MNILAAANVLAESAFLQRKLQAAEVGIAAALDIAGNPKAMANARVGAARLLLDFAGVLGSGRAAAGAAKEPASMTTEELRGLLARTDAEIASRARLVGPEKATTIEQELDFIG